MRVLILSFPYASAAGGGERYLEQVVEGLSPKGFDFSLVSSSKALLSIFRRNGWDALSLWCGVEPVSKLAILLSPFTFLIAAPTLFVLLLAARINGARTVVCLSLTDKLVATPFAKLLGMRVIWMEHLVPGRSLVSNPYRSLYASTSRFTDIVCVSEAVASGLVALGLSRARIRIVPPGVSEPRGQAGLSGAPTVGVVSRLAKEKNVGALLRAFVGVAKRLPEARLEIFGDGPERSSLVSLASSLGISERVRFHGYVEDDASRYRHLALLAVPSRKESFGIAALEAMSWGLPVVASRVEGLPELVIDGKTGILADADDDAAWTEAIVRLLADRALGKRLGDEGRIRSRQFTLAKNLAAWESLLHG